MAVISITEDVNFEIFSLIWLDASVNQSKENLGTQQKLRSIIHHLKVFETLPNCEEYIHQTSTNDRLVLIVSGRLGREILPRIHHYRQILSIYVYCMNKKANEEWAKHFTKIKDVINKSDQLFHQIQSDQLKRIENKVQEPLTINISQLNHLTERSINQHNGEFLHSQLLIDCLLRMKSDSSERNELIHFCRQIYQHNPTELTLIKEFEEKYSSNQALWWYTRESCLYRLLNKALRVQNIDLLYLFRFFLRDLAKQLQEYQCPSSVRAYRGQLMSMEEFNQLNQSCGKYISINSFFSTSLNRRKALKFLTDESSSNDLHKVLFEIDASADINHRTSFANITSLSCYAYEEEILFMIGSIFHLINIQHEKTGLCIIQLTLIDDQNKNFQHLFNDIKTQCHATNDETNLLTFGNILHQMGKYDLAEKYFHRLLADSSEDQETISRCYHALGVIALINDDDQASLQWYEKVLDMLPSDNPRLADSYNCIGCIYQRKEDARNALEFYNRALEIWRNTFGEEHYQFADCLNNIGCVYEIEKDYSQALEYHQQALAIRKKCLAQNHPDLGGSYNNIGNIYLFLKEYDFALENYQSSYQIKSKSLPSQHVSLASTLENIALVYEQKGLWDQALASYQKAACIFRKTFPSTHVYVIEIERSIEHILSILDSQILITKF